KSSAPSLPLRAAAADTRPTETAPTTVRRWHYRVVWDAPADCAREPAPARSGSRLAWRADLTHRKRETWLWCQLFRCEPALLPRPRLLARDGARTALLRQSIPGG